MDLVDFSRVNDFNEEPETSIENFDEMHVDRLLKRFRAARRELEESDSDD